MSEYLDMLSIYQQVNYAIWTDLYYLNAKYMTESELMPSTSSWFQSKLNQKNDTYKLKRSVVLIHMYVCTGDASATKIDSFSQI